MRLLIATPAYGGHVTCSYLQSLMQTIPHLQEMGIFVGLHMLESESLISRGRNTAATYALKEGFDKILFIDADVIFTPEKVKMLLASSEKIVGGTYPLKNHPITINFNPLPQHRELFGEDRQQDNYTAWVRKHADPTGEVEVLHVPTGFLLIDCSVLAKLTYKVPWYVIYNPDVKTHVQCYDFFPVRVNEGHEYESEDWAFCAIARENGYRIILQTRAVCGHVGIHKYGLGQHIVIGTEPLIPGPNPR